MWQALRLWVLWRPLARQCIDALAKAINKFSGGVVLATLWQGDSYHIAAWEERALE